MRVVYASDDNYFAYVYVSVATLLENNRNDSLAITYIEQDVSDEHIAMLSELGREYDRDIEIRPFDMPEVLDRVPAFAASKTTWAKFFFAKMFPDESRVLFLDPDTLVLEDLSELFELDMGSNLIGGIPECLPKYHRTASKLSDDDIYINGGVVLCNLTQWRKDGFEELAIERLGNMCLNLNYDQGVINELCKGRVLRLEPKYCVLAEMFQFRSAKKLMQRFGFTNYYTQEEIATAVNHPAIVHFTGYLYLKPYSRNCTHPYAKTFWNIAEQSPLNLKLNDIKLNKKQVFRKFVLEHMPFSVFLLVEKILDLRRSYLLTREGNA